MIEVVEQASGLLVVHNVLDVVESPTPAEEIVPMPEPEIEDSLPTGQYL